MDPTLVDTDEMRQHDKKLEEFIDTLQLIADAIHQLTIRDDGIKRTLMGNPNAKTVKRFY